MSDQDFLSGHFLIAMPSLGDPNFHHAVTLVCEHSSEGAMGITINRPMDDIRLGDVLEQLDVNDPPQAMAERRLFAGGPVERERGFVIHRPPGEWEATIRLQDGLAVTSSRDVLQAMGRGEGPQDCIVALGYAGWAPGQLEQEMVDNAWLSSPADPEILFRTDPANRWREAARSMGVDLDRLSEHSGRA